MTPQPNTQLQTPETDAIWPEIQKKHAHFQTDGCHTSFWYRCYNDVVEKHKRLETRLHEAVANLERYGGVITNRNERVDSLLAEHTSLLAQIETLKRHWIEDDRDLNEMLAQIAVKDEALKHGIACTRCADCIDQMQHALTNSPAAAREMVERVERMSNCLKTLKSDHNASMREASDVGFSDGIFFRPSQLKMIDEALATTKKPEGGV